MSEWSFRNRFLRGYQEDDATENKEDDGEGNKVAVCRSKCQISVAVSPVRAA